VVAFGTKAALLPVVFWLPGTYPAPSAPIAAFFAGIMTKLGAYSLFRISPLLLSGTSLPTVLVWVGAASALLGVLAALSQYELRRLLAFHSVSQMGYIVASLGLLSVTGMAGALYFLVHHALVKASLYLVADELERRHGHRDLRRMPVSKTGSLALLGGLFLVSAITLAGLPPTSGFIAKVSVFGAGMDAGAWVPLTALVLASLFTLASMLKIWQFAFQGNGTESPPALRPSTPRPWLAPLGALVALTVLLSVSAGPALRFARSTAEQLLDVDAYVTHVNSAPGHGFGREGVWR
jgi:multicomponent Na+:H+ antiporter subunit D